MEEFDHSMISVTLIADRTLVQMDAVQQESIAKNCGITVRTYDAAGKPVPPPSPATPPPEKP